MQQETMTGEAGSRLNYDRWGWLTFKLWQVRLAHI